MGSPTMGPARRASPGPVAGEGGESLSLHHGGWPVEKARVLPGNSSPALFVFQGHKRGANLRNSLIMMAALLGLEPRNTEPKSGVLPITLQGSCLSAGAR